MGVDAYDATRLFTTSYLRYGVGRTDAGGWFSGGRRRNRGRGYYKAQASRGVPAPQETFSPEEQRIQGLQELRRP